jgi:hypothetical protein
MQVEKIIITKELIDIPDGKSEWIEVKLDNQFMGVLHEGREYVPATVTEQRTLWKVQRVRTHTGEEKKYLVKVDDRDIFNELEVVERTTFESHLAKVLHERTRSLEIHYLKELAQQRSKILRLPWWKRLFKKF